MRKIITLVISLVMITALFVGSAMAAESTDQVTELGGIIFYDDSGKELENASKLGEDGAIVSVKKTATQRKDASGAAIENEFLMELQVSTTQNITHLLSQSPDAAVTLILDISRTMSECVYCGHGSAYPCHMQGKESTCPYWNTGTDATDENRFTSRLAATKAAAIDFVNQFAAMDAGANAHRYVALITYSDKARVVQSYIDVADSTNLSQLTTTIKSLDISDATGTNIEGGVRLARNIMMEAARTGGILDGVGHLSTILLTDGEPNFAMNDNDEGKTDDIGGSMDFSITAIDSIPGDTDYIRNTLKSQFYSICLGFEIDHVTGATKAVKDKTINIGDNSIPIKAWMSSFSDGFYSDADESTTILDTFEAVFEEIKTAATSWTVSDLMGPHITYLGPANDIDMDQSSDSKQNAVSFANGELTWNILHSKKDSKSSTADVTVYTYEYLVRLENLKSTDYNHAPTPTNASALLDYAVEKTVNGVTQWKMVQNVAFPKPEVDGYTGTLSFKKVDNHGSPVSGMIFYVRSSELPDWVREATSADDGTVTFSFLPSGHAYYLEESEHLHYQSLGAQPFSISWGDTVPAQNAKFQPDGNGGLTLVNQIEEHENNAINLVVTKTFNGVDDADLADTAQAYAHFVVEYPDEDRSDEAFNLYAGSLSFDTGNINEGDHVISETQWNIPGYALTDTALTVTKTLHAAGENGQDETSSVYTTTFSADAAKTYTLAAQRDADQKTTYTAAFTNTYRKMTGSITVEKKFYAHEIATGVCAEDAQPMDDDAIASVSTTVSLYKKADVVAAAATAVPFRTAPLSSSGWSTTFENLPVGEYILLESAPTGSITGHEFVHAQFPVTGADGKTTHYNALKAGSVLTVNDGITVTVTDGGNQTVQLENHYEPCYAYIQVQKHFHGDIEFGDTSQIDTFLELYKTLNPDAADADNPTVYADVYTGNQTNSTPNENPVAQLTLGKGNSFLQSTAPLPAGTYTVIERAPYLSLPGYTHNVKPVLVTLTHDNHGEHVTVDLVNEYTQQKGRLTIKKEFADTAVQAMFAERSIAVYVRRTRGNKIYDTVLLNEDNNWQKTLEDVPFDEYELIEEIRNFGTDEENKENNSAFVENMAVIATWAPETGILPAASHPYNVTLEDWALWQQRVAEGDNKPITRVVTNNYVQQVHPIQIKKTVSGLDPLPDGYSVTVQIIPQRKNDEDQWVNDLSAGVREHVITPSGASPLFYLPSGTYRIEETVSGAPDTHTQGAPSFSLSSSAQEEEDGHTHHLTLHGQTGVFTINDDEHVDSHYMIINVNNPYTLKPAKVTLKKTFSGAYLDADGKPNPETMPESVEFVLTPANTAEHRVVTVSLPYEGKWEKTVDLAADTYTVTETITAQDVVNTWKGVNADGTITLQPHVEGATIPVIECDNRLDLLLEVFVPLSKQVVQGGALPVPADTVFRFKLDVKLPTGAAMNVSAKTLESIVKYDRANGLLDVRTDASGRFNGHLVFSGFADALNGASVRITELLHPFASEADAAAAGWTYDRSEYIADITSAGHNQAAATITRGNEKANAALFTNTYTVNMPSGGLPETGDGSSILLWASALTLSGALLFLLRRRQGKS